ncbi:MAG TPA: hypothetical protein VME46_23815 [Acidimicrobiales bacterium]|nr:hypothetical protein [Acidimicrobiales bacterium]
MHIAYLAVTGLAALMNGYAATMNFIGAEFVKVVADKATRARRAAPHISKVRVVLGVCQRNYARAHPGGGRVADQDSPISSESVRRSLTAWSNGHPASSAGDGTTSSSNRDGDRGPPEEATPAAIALPETSTDEPDALEHLAKPVYGQSRLSVLRCVLAISTL